MISTADLCDEFGDQVAVCTTPFQHFGRWPSFAGPCVTLGSVEDHQAVRALFSEPGKSRVAVIDGAGSLRIALMGDQIAYIAARHNWAGVIVYGAIRDVAVLQTMELSVRALGTVPRRATVSGTAVRDVPVSFGGATFNPGDWVAADADGLIVSRQRLVV